MAKWHSRSRDWAVWLEQQNMGAEQRERRLVKWASQDPGRERA